MVRSSIRESATRSPTPARHRLSHEHIPSRSLQPLLCVEEHARARIMCLLGEAYRHEAERLAQLKGRNAIDQHDYSRFLADVQDSYRALRNEADELLRSGSESADVVANRLVGCLSSLYVWADSVLCNAHMHARHTSIITPDKTFHSQPDGDLSSLPHTFNTNDSRAKFTRGEIALGRSNCTVLLSFGAVPAASRHKVEELVRRRHYVLWEAESDRLNKSKSISSTPTVSPSGNVVRSPPDLSDEDAEDEEDAAAGRMTSTSDSHGRNDDEEEDETVILCEPNLEILRLYETIRADDFY